MFDYFNVDVQLDHVSELVSANILHYQVNISLVILVQKISISNKQFVKTMNKNIDILTFQIWIQWNQELSKWCYLISASLKSNWNSWIYDKCAIGESNSEVNASQ